MNNNNTKRIVLTGGGSGGHIYPLLAVAEEFERQTTEIEAWYIGPEEEYDEAFKTLHVKIHHIPGSKLRRYASLDNLFDIFRLIMGILKCLRLLFIIMPDIVFIKGGPGSIAVAIAAKFYLIPIVIHESDALPSLTTKLLGGRSKKILTSFESTAEHLGKHKSKAIYVGNPVRTHLFNDIAIPKEEAKQALNLNPDQPLLLVIGGSQGAEFLNSFITENIQEILKVTQVIHQTGRANIKNVQEEVNNLQKTTAYQVYAYLENEKIRDAFAAADVILTRAGSSVLFEIALTKVPAIIVPITESANNHQRQNAHSYAAEGGGIVIEEANMGPNLFINQLTKILESQEIQNNMKKGAANFSKPKSAEQISKILLE